MSYSTATIGSVLDDVNRKFFLPAIQRPYVWSDAQIIALFDSILKGYPISSFMMWAIDDQMKRNLKIYKFFENYRSGDENEPAAPDGRQTVLVLDGQQRLTSLCIGLRGTYADKSKHARRSNPNAWTRKTLYLNLLKDPEGADEEEHDFGVTYGLQFHAVPPRNDHRHHWIKLASILDYKTAEQLESLVLSIGGDLHHGVTPYEKELAIATIRRLHQAIWSQEAINIYTESSDCVDRVLEIFVRANDGGAKLTKSDLLMSMITSRWGGGNAREEVHKFVAFINDGIGAENKINKDLVMKACLVLCDFDVRYNVSNFTDHTIGTIEARWAEITNAIERTFRLINSFGIDAHNLTSLNAVLPLCYYIFHNRGFTFRGSSEFEAASRTEMHRWLINSLLVGAFAGSSDRTIGWARATIAEHIKTERDFPAEKLFQALGRGGRLARLDERAITEILDLKYGKPKTFLALSLLYPDYRFNVARPHKDHIIPRSRADRRVLMSMNIAEHRISEILNCVDRIGNLQLLSGEENVEKNDIPFDSWITGRDESFKALHFIPEQADYWRASMLPEFVREREMLIKNRLAEIMGAQLV